MPRPHFPLSLFCFIAIFFTYPVVAGGILADQINQIIIQGQFTETTPTFLAVFSSTPVRDARGALLTAMAPDTAEKIANTKQTVAIKLYGKPASRPGRFDYFFGTLYDANRPWNNGTDFRWQDWETVSADIWDNVLIAYLPQDGRLSKKPSGLITHVTLRRGGKILYDSRVRQSYPNKKPIAVSFKPFDLSPQSWGYPLLNLAERMERFRNDYYELGGHPILSSAYADLGQTEKKKYASRGKNWCSEFASYIYRQNGYPAPDPNNGDVSWKNMRAFFERHGAVYTLREVSAWSDEDKIAKIKPGAFVSILNGKSTHSLIFATWIAAGRTPINQYTAVSGNNKGMVWSHAPLSLPVKEQFQGMTPEQLADYDQKVFFGVIPDRK